MSDEPENAALAGFAVHTEGKAVVDEDGLCDGKPQPCADLAGVRAGAVVFVKDIGKIFPGNARAVVLNLYPHGGVRLRFYAQRHTGQEFARMENYDLCLNTASVNREMAILLLKAFVENQEN